MQFPSSSIHICDNGFTASPVQRFQPSSRTAWTLRCYRPKMPDTKGRNNGFPRWVARQLPAAQCRELLWNDLHGFAQQPREPTGLPFTGGAWPCRRCNGRSCMHTPWTLRISRLRQLQPSTILVPLAWRTHRCRPSLIPATAKRWKPPLNATPGT